MTDHAAAEAPEDLAHLLVDRLNAGDIDGLVALYEPDAVLACPGGIVATGSTAIREFYASLVAQGLRFEPGDQRPALRNGGLALTTSRLGNGAVTAEVARQQSDGTWLWVVDQPSILS